MNNAVSGDKMLPEGLSGGIDAVVPTAVTHIGIVLSDTQGRFLISQPHGQPYGVTSTFSKVKRTSGESASHALNRCLAEQVGRDPCSVYPVNPVWVTPNSTGFYFAGLIQDNPEGVRATAATLHWCAEAEARAQLQSSQNVTSRTRDLALLDSVRGMCLSPYRRVLLMLQELHRQGFERLRAHGYIYALGTWRCEIIPAGWMLTHDRRLPDAAPSGMRERAEGLLGVPNATRFYTSALMQRVFKDKEAVFLTPRDMAQRFLREHPAIAAAGYGPDEEYAAWLSHTLDALAPNGIFYASAEEQAPTDHLYTLMSGVDSVPLPPPGRLDPEDWRRFQSRIGLKSE